MVQKRWIVFAGTVLAAGFLYLIAGASSFSVKLLLNGATITAAGILTLREELRNDRTLV